jgi:hypothetical protein
MVLLPPLVPSLPLYMLFSIACCYGNMKNWGRCHEDSGKQEWQLMLIRALLAGMPFNLQYIIYAC